ncbi:MAG: hybrid sensor histidine kinase/response regulator, partial [Nitriliruptorales bacterium]|nr:hybrid sensor histidine kinase/response regulator [Nitriliruptorales bacterium]
AEHAPDATILILSGYSEGAAAESATKAGAHGYIEKGLSPRDLLGRLDSMLGYLTDNHGAPPNRFVPPPDIRIEPNAVLGQLAHDLRSPMLAARGLVQVLASELPTETQERELANRASSALAHLEGLITDALAYARAEAASLTLVQLEVGPLIDRVVDGLETAERVEIDSAPGTVVADASALERVIRNLIENAIRYSPGRVTVRSEPSAEERVRISVLDRGPGVDPAEGNDLFRPFFRGSSASASRGSGLGLAACARIVQQLEGRIWAENRDDGGAAFHVELPRGDRNPIF